MKVRIERKGKPKPISRIDSDRYWLVVGREPMSWGNPNLALKRELRNYQEFCKDMTG